MAGAPFLSPFYPGAENSTRGMSTEGVLRLLARESLSIEPNELANIRKARPELPKTYGRYDALYLDGIDGILWTAVTDAVYLTPSARCPDLSVYPVHDGVVQTTGASLSRQAILALWGRLRDVTKETTFRGIVHYPTDHLDSPEWKRRIDSIQNEADDFFQGWKQFTIRPELAKTGDYWAHYSERAKQNLWQQIQEWLCITR
jgi:hypothetical protein